MEDYIFNTQHPLATNSETMTVFIEDHFYDVFDSEAQVLQVDGTYAEVESDNKIYAVNASGNGDFISHRIRFEILNQYQGTKGIWSTDYDELGNRIYVDSNTSGNGSVCQINTNDKNLLQAPIDAELIADAGNTIQSCGLLPSQLLKQRDEMRAFLLDVSILIPSEKGLLMDIKYKIKSYLKSTESTNP